MNPRFILYLLTMAAVTYLIRMLPMVLMKKEIHNRFILSFLHYIPYAVLAVMTVPAIFTATSSVWSAAIGFAVALLLAFFTENLLIVALGSCVGVFLTELLMTLL